MPSARKQLNVRLDEEMERLFAELLPKASAATGLKVSQSDVIRLALQSLAREYAAQGDDSDAAKPGPKPRKPKA